MFDLTNKEEFFANLTEDELIEISEILTEKQLLEFITDYVGLTFENFINGDFYCDYADEFRDFIEEKLTPEQIMKVIYLYKY